MGSLRGEGCERYLGISILELVLRQLRQANFTADVAFPGQKFPRVTEPMAAVHIEKVDRAGMTVTVEVNIICPAALGGTACELEALRATEALQWAGAICVQNGCSYDGIAQVYVVQVLATFTGVAEADTFHRGPGFQVYINNIIQADAVQISAEETPGQQPEYVMGETLPADYYPGDSVWNLQMEELLLSGTPEPAEPEGDFTLKIVSMLKTEVYSGCRWNSVYREYTRDGLRRIRKGIARKREEV